MKKKFDVYRPYMKIKNSFGEILVFWGSTYGEEPRIINLKQTNV